MRNAQGKSLLYSFFFSQLGLIRVLENLYKINQRPRETRFPNWFYLDFLQSLHVAFVVTFKKNIINFLAWERRIL